MCQESVPMFYVTVAVSGKPTKGVVLNLGKAQRDEECGHRWIPSSVQRRPQLGLQNQLWLEPLWTRKSLISSLTAVSQAELSIKSKNLVLLGKYVMSCYSVQVRYTQYMNVFGLCLQLFFPHLEFNFFLVLNKIRQVIQLFCWIGQQKSNGSQIHWKTHPTEIWQNEDIFRSKLGPAERVCITANAWSAGTTSFQGVTASIPWVDCIGLPAKSGLSQLGNPGQHLRGRSSWLRYSEQNYWMRHWCRVTLGEVLGHFCCSSDFKRCPLTQLVKTLKMRSLIWQIL